MEGTAQAISSIASVADSDMDEVEIEIQRLLREYEDENGEGNVEFRRAMKLHLTLVLQVVRNTPRLQDDVEKYLRDVAEG